MSEELFIQFQCYLPLHDTDYACCLVFHDKLYDLTPILHDFAYQIHPGPTTLNEPHNLLIFIIGWLYNTPPKFDTESYQLRTSALRVRTLCNYCYGHIPDLRMWGEFCILVSSVDTMARSIELHHCCLFQYL